MIRTVLLGAFLTVMWVALWGDASIGTVVAGIGAAILVIVLVPSPESDRRWVFRPLGVLRFVATFLGLLVASTWSMVVLVLSDRAKDATGILIEVELAAASYPVRTLIAHSISLTPGTLTVDVRPDGRTLQVHVIEAADEPAARRAISALEHRAREAFAPRLPEGERPDNPITEAN
ncbi:Na+/H+ antiporter subunit E [soil metagenome]